jgi:hypothetical protein
LWTAASGVADPAGLAAFPAQAQGRAVQRRAGQFDVRHGAAEQRAARRRRQRYQRVQAEADVDRQQAPARRVGHLGAQVDAAHWLRAHAGQHQQCSLAVGGEMRARLRSHGEGGAGQRRLQRSQLRAGGVDSRCGQPARMGGDGPGAGGGQQQRGQAKAQHRTGRAETRHPDARQCKPPPARARARTRDRARPRAQVARAPPLRAPCRQPAEYSTDHRVPFVPNYPRPYSRGRRKNRGLRTAIRRFVPRFVQPVARRWSRIPPLATVTTSKPQPQRSTK